MSIFYGKMKEFICKKESGGEIVAPQMIVYDVFCNRMNRITLAGVLGDKAQTLYDSRQLREGTLIMCKYDETCSWITQYHSTEIVASEIKYRNIYHSMKTVPYWTFFSSGERSQILNALSDDYERLHMCTECGAIIFGGSKAHMSEPDEYGRYSKTMCDDCRCKKEDNGAILDAFSVEVGTHSDTFGNQVDSILNRLKALHETGIAIDWR